MQLLRDCLHRWQLFQRDGLIYKQCIHCGQIVGSQDE